jgi:hypothetical protein
MHWELLIAALAFAFSVTSYTFTRSKELAWRRTEFLCAQLQHLDTDLDLVKAVRILEDRAEITIADIFDPETTLDKEKLNEYLQRMDKLLNFFWRISYAFLETQTITQKEVEGFGWYYWRISQFPLLLTYCQANGYGKINATIKALDYVKEMRRQRQLGDSAS